VIAGVFHPSSCSEARMTAGSLAEPVSQADSVSSGMISWRRKSHTDA
jgi:hypothetical protein